MWMFLHSGGEWERTRISSKAACVVALHIGSVPQQCGM